MIAFVRRAADDQRGAAAIEFVLVFPTLFLLHVAAAEALEVYQAQRNITHIAAAMADITAQARTVTTEELDDTLRASIAMIYPYPTLGLQQRITSFTANASGTITQDWSVKRDYIASSAPVLPPGYLLAGESVIVTDVIYDYKPTFGLFLPKTIRFTKHAYVRPRLSAKVEKVA